MKSIIPPLSVMEKLTTLVVVVAAIKFLFEGGSVHVFGHADASTYATFLAPVLGAHGYIRTRNKSEPKPGKRNVDNPDAN